MGEITLIHSFCHCYFLVRPKYDKTTWIYRFQSKVHVYGMGGSSDDSLSFGILSKSVVLSGLFGAVYLYNR